MFYRLSHFFFWKYKQLLKLSNDLSIWQRRQYLSRKTHLFTSSGGSDSQTNATLSAKSQLSEFWINFRHSVTAINGLFIVTYAHLRHDLNRPTTFHFHHWKIFRLNVWRLLKDSGSVTEFFWLSILTLLPLHVCTAVNWLLVSILSWKDTEFTDKCQFTHFELCYSWDLVYSVIIKLLLGNFLSVVMIIENNPDHNNRLSFHANWPKKPWLCSVVATGSSQVAERNTSPWTRNQNAIAKAVHIRCSHAFC